jgi:hypothetical protein
MGMSGDLRRRLREHQSGKSQSTSERRPWTLIYYEARLEEQDAAGRAMAILLEWPPASLFLRGLLRGREFCDVFESDQVVGCSIYCGLPVK